MSDSAYYARNHHSREVVYLGAPALTKARAAGIRFAEALVLHCDKITITRSTTIVMPVPFFCITSMRFQIPAARKEIAPIALSKPEL